MSRVFMWCVMGVLCTACADSPTTSEPRADITVQADVQPVAVVSPFGCAVIRGGQVNRPAGALIQIVQAWQTKNKGLLVDFLQAQTTTVSVNGGALIDLSDAYSAPADLAAVFSSAASYDTGIALAVGESMSIVFVIELSHRVHDGFTFAEQDTHRPLFFGPGEAFEFVCTVTGV
jgi:hypothetical protein